MKKIISAFILIFNFFIADAQFSLDLKPKDKLIYDVSAGGAEYNFLVTIKALKPGFNFDWIMTNENANNGSIKIAPAAIASSKKCIIISVMVIKL